RSRSAGRPSSSCQSSASSGSDPRDGRRDPSSRVIAGADPPARWWQLAVLTAGILLAEAPWFASGAVAPLLRVEWATTGLDIPLLTVAVQVGFAVGALGLAIAGAADVLPGIRLFVVGCVAAAAANLGFAFLATD